AVGSSHAMTSRTAALDHALLARLAKTVDVPLVLHGSSGLPDAELAAAVAGGIRKVNIGTALNLAMTEAIRTHLTPADPRPYLTAARTAMAATAAAMITALN
ncbi:fructose-bisphosphate aldolase, partial [Streptomyces sp. NRRL S-444]